MHSRATQNALIFGKLLPVRLQASGYGWCVWGGARVLCTLLLTVPELLENRSVLEIGSGVGLCGLFAGKLSTPCTVPRKRLGPCEVSVNLPHGSTYHAGWPSW